MSQNSCLDTGRKCEGPVPRRIQFFGDESATPSNAVLLPEVNLFAPQHNDEERWAFNYFLHRAAPIFAGVVDGPFWLELVPRLAQSHAFVWNVVIASSWIFEHVNYNDLETAYTPCDASAVTDVEHRKALKWYQRALIDFRHLLERGEADNDYILLSCILFAGLEFQQRQVGNAWRLIDTAFTLIDQSLSMSQTQMSKLKDPTLYEFVTAFFSRKAVFMGPLGRPIPLKWNIHPAKETLLPSMKSSLAVLEDAKAQLESLMYQSYEVVRVGHLLYHDDYEMQKLKPRQELHLKAVQQWKDTFHQLCVNGQGDERGCIVSTLLMYWEMCYILLAVCTSPLQTSFDKHMNGFAAIVDDAQIVLQCIAASDKEGQELLRDGDVIPPLLFTATKCRDPILRRKALQLLRQAPYRTGLWSSVASPGLVEKMIAVEEDGVHFSAYPVPSPSICPPPEERRIHHFAIVRGETSDGGRRLKVRLTKAAPDTMGSLRMVHEEIWVEERTESWP
ncbi:hypothetical protein A1O7_05897 [Cladophialophora yegresii CBS 114405]|uniref:Transcription factor domain-containing protein n=1 Tax=Cladophialophora yegresii CBS 114405 TaxID=1182544 RepID=W9VRX9_9EURO|nr:uncharacterized protein A1O7_05897 [Cladophialophora yegresii CBS 114405]EXJ58472.1 hypothetical protein A1O7_05897 [Cladophialophora yegresii CBS 114405]